MLWRITAQDLNICVFLSPKWEIIFSVLRALCRRLSIIACVILENIHTSLTEGIFSKTLPPFWKFQLSFIHVYNFFGLTEPPTLLWNSNSFWGGHTCKDFLELHINKKKLCITLLQFLTNKRVNACGVWNMAKWMQLMYKVKNIWAQHVQRTEKENLSTFLQIYIVIVFTVCIQLFELL